MAALSLRQRALAALARREYSRMELRRKLASHAESEASLDRLLDELEALKLLSAARFAESLARRRAERYGAARIRQELAQHQLPADEMARQMQDLQATEIGRCRLVWQKKFGALPTTFEERAKQMRFLLGRGFDHHAVKAVLSGVEAS